MNKWERETFLPKLADRPMTEKAYAKIARHYDFKHHNKTRLIMNEIHKTAKTINKISNLVQDVDVSMSIQCPSRHLLKERWSRDKFLRELQSGPMGDTRFDFIMDNIGTDTTRKYRQEWDKQREVANTIWGTVNCGNIKKKEKEGVTA